MPRARPSRYALILNTAQSAAVPVRMRPHALSRTLALLPLLAAHLATARGGRGGLEVVLVGGRAVVVVVALAAVPVVVLAGHASTLGLSEFILAKRQGKPTKLFLHSLGLSIEHIHTAWPPSGACVRGCW